MICADVIDLVSKATGMTVKEIAAGAGIEENKFRALLSRDTMRLHQLMDALDYAGVSVKLILNRNGLEIWPSKSDMRRVRRMVNRVIYDTNHATAISNDFDVADSSCMHQLFRDYDGRYFMAEYSDDRDRIVPCSGDEAAEFMHKYGASR